MNPVPEYAFAPQHSGSRCSSKAALLRGKAQKAAKNGFHGKSHEHGPPEAEPVFRMGQQGEVVEAELRAFEGVVVTVSPPDASGRLGLVVEVPAQQAPELAARSATGKLAVVLDTRER